MEKEVINCVLNNSNFDNATNIITLIVSILNLIFIVLFYVRDKKEHKKEKNRDYKNSWFNMVNVKERIKNLNNIINNVKDFSLKILENEEDSLEKRKELMQKSLEKLNGEFVNEKNSFTYLLRCIDDEKNQQLCKLYNDFQDSYMKILESAVLKDTLDYSSLQSVLSKITELYYNLGIEIMNN